jgi:hypothetical protein
MEINPSNFTELMDLDNTVNRAVTKNTSGLSEALIDVPEMEDLQIPEYFDQFDHRKPPRKWVEDKIQNKVADLFEKRMSLETRMSRRELVAYD